MKIYKATMMADCTEENYLTYSIETTEITYESEWYATRELAETHLEALYEIRKELWEKGFHAGAPKIIEQEIYEEQQKLKHTIEDISRSNY